MVCNILHVSKGTFKMARTGLDKTDVKNARESLLAQGKNPSVDAIRVELGNTGSKTTIHKYLKELESESVQGIGNQLDISAALQQLVASLSEQLHTEANIEIEKKQQEMDEQKEEHQKQILALRNEIQALIDKLASSHKTLEQEKLAHQQAQNALQHETVTRHTLEQHVIDLKTQLSTNEEYRHSLEEKHQHVQKALEHYRQSVKEQREQDLRRHDQQIQHLQSEIRLLQQTIIVKQGDVTNLKENNSAISTELHLLKQSFDASNKEKNVLLQKNKELELIENKYNIQKDNILTKESEIQELREELFLKKSQTRELENCLSQVNLEIGVAHSKLVIQEILISELRLLTQATIKN